jgi:uncharacterized protein YkwD
VTARQNNLALIYLCAALLVTAALGARADGLSSTQQAQSDVQAARLEMGCNNCDQAVSLLQAAEHLLPSHCPFSIVPHQYLALAYQKQGDEDHAVAEYMLIEADKYDNLPSGRSNSADSKDAILQQEATTLWLINKTRADNSLPLLLPDPRLAVIAREHSLEMRDLAYFEHESPTASLRTPMDRFNAFFNYFPRCIAENIARRWGSAPCFTPDNIAGTHQDFMHSPGHRANILSEEVTTAGIGIALNAAGAYWITEDFAKYTTQE